MKSNKNETKIFQAFLSLPLQKKVSFFRFRFFEKFFFERRYIYVDRRKVVSFWVLCRHIFTWLMTYLCTCTTDGDKAAETFSCVLGCVHPVVVGKCLTCGISQWTLPGLEFWWSRCKSVSGIWDWKEKGGKYVFNKRPEQQERNEVMQLAIYFCAQRKNSKQKKNLRCTRTWFFLLLILFHLRLLLHLDKYSWEVDESKYKKNISSLHSHSRRTRVWSHTQKKFFLSLAFHLRTHLGK